MEGKDPADIFETKKLCFYSLYGKHDKIMVSALVS